MKKCFSLILFSLAFASLSYGTHVFIPYGIYDGQIYMEGGASMGWQNDYKLEGETISLETGYAGRLEAGYYLNDQWRIGLEGSLRRFDFDKVAGVDASGYTRHLAIMFNTCYEFPISIQDAYLYGLSIYLGGGLGVDFNRIKNGITNQEDSESLFAWQIMTGLAVEVNKYWAFTAGYRFFASTKPSIDNKKPKKLPYSNNIELGARLRF